MLVRERIVSTLGGRGASTQSFAERTSSTLWSVRGGTCVEFNRAISLRSRTIQSAGFSLDETRMSHGLMQRRAAISQKSPTSPSAQASDARKRLSQDSATELSTNRMTSSEHVTESRESKNGRSRGERTFGNYTPW